MCSRPTRSVLTGRWCATLDVCMESIRAGSEGCAHFMLKSMSSILICSRPVRNSSRCICSSSSLTSKKRTWSSHFARKGYSDSAGLPAIQSACADVLGACVMCARHARACPQPLLGIPVSLALLSCPSKHTFRLVARHACAASAADRCITDSCRPAAGALQAGQHQAPARRRRTRGRQLGRNLVKVVQQPGLLRREGLDPPERVPDRQRAAHQLVPCAPPRHALVTVRLGCLIRPPVLMVDVFAVRDRRRKVLQLGGSLRTARRVHGVDAQVGAAQAHCALRRERARWVVLRHHQPMPALQRVRRHR
jgi:hypothetical protein